MEEFLRGRRPPEVSRPREKSRETAKETAELPGIIAEKMTDLVREYGLETLQAMLAKMQAAVDEGRPLKAQELQETIETRSPASEFQEKTLEAFEALGFVETLAGGRLVVDHQRLFDEFSIKDLQRLPGQPFKSLKQLPKSRLEFLGQAFAGKQTLLRTDFKADPERAEPRPLFYLPETRTEALDPEKIRSSKFHFGLWEIPQATKGAETQAVDISQPASLTQQTFFETSLAAILYHPDYGNARRDDNGKLLITEDGAEKPVSGNWLAEQGLKFVVDGKPMAVRNNTREVISKYASELVHRELFKPEDLARESFRNRAAETAGISSNGTMSVGGVKHYLGRQFVGRSLRIDNMGNGLAALVELDENGLGTPVGLINALEKGDPRLTERKTNTGSFFEAGGKLTNPRTFNEQEFTTPKPDENPDVFFERKQKFEAFKAVLDFDNALKQETSLGIFDIAPELQQALRDQGQKLRNQEKLALEFVKAFGQPGLEILAATLENTAISEKVLQTSLDLPPQEQKAVIPQLRTALLARRQALAELQTQRNDNRITDLEYRKMTFEINRRVTSLLIAAEDSAAIRDSDSSTTKQEALERLADQGNELVLFSSIFKDAFKGTGEMDFEAMKGLDVETKHGNTLDQDTQAAMLAIFEANWKEQKPEALTTLRNGFLKKLTDSPETQFHVLKKDGRVVAFIRFDERPDLEPGALYGGSLNVDPSLRGSAIGEAMMKAAVDEAAREHVIYADVFPELQVGMKYVEDLGCVITGVEEVQVDDSGKTTTRLLLKRNDAENSQYERGGKQAVTKTLDLRKGTQELVALIASQTAEGKVATRYFADPKNPNLRTLVFEPKAVAEQLAEAA
jgi:hypothetical protein